MSCRTTHAGTLALRLARAQTGLSDRSVQSLFHALKREGKELDPPTEDDLDMLRLRYRALIEETGMTESMRDRSERDLLLLRDETLDGSTFYALERIEARVRQEQVIRSVKGLVIDLEEPGSQADQYRLGEDGRPTHVWYASYGSNLSRDRFNTYIAGGTPEGSSTAHDGARDKELPAEDAPIRFSGRMHFASSSGRWGGGGVAFMDNESSGHALGRAYLVTMEQFDDVVAQENGRTVGSVTVDTKDAIGGQPVTVMAAGLYGTMAHIGDYEGAPVLTFTGNFSATDAITSAADTKTFGQSTNPPSGNYLRMIGSGLGETFGMSVDEQADYLRGSAGAERMTRADVVRILSTPPDEVPVHKPKKSTSSTRSSGRSTRGMNSGWRDTWVNDRSGSTRSNRDYQTWWESGSSSRDVEYLDDWGYDTPMALSGFDSDEDYSQAQWEAMLQEEQNWNAGQRRGAWTKRCAMCGDYTHTMHDCPLMGGSGA